MQSRDSRKYYPKKASYGLGRENSAVAQFELVKTLQESLNGVEFTVTVSPIRIDTRDGIQFEFVKINFREDGIKFDYSVLYPRPKIW